ncbi:MAG: histidine triad nucleotide-binding protein [Anaerolineae bacterium]|jgi:histidine triad (HIT) family protein|nr:histidine triad nucleotide-binding protein [Anaerolineae bacterium]
MSDCIFCRIARGESPARIVYQDEDVTVFHDLHPQAPVHVLIIPNRHITSVAKAGLGDEPVLGKLFTVARRAAEELGATDYRLVINNGSQAGQSVFHLHMHLLGGRRMSWPPG